MKAIFIILIFLSSSSIFSQNFEPNSLVSDFNKSGKIEGVIVDYKASTSILAFTNITVKNTSISTTSDINGEYKLKLMPGNYTIIFDFIGYKTIEVKNINVIASYTTTLNQKLSPLQPNADLTFTNTPEI